MSTPGRCLGSRASSPQSSSASRRPGAPSPPGSRLALVEAAIASADISGYHLGPEYREVLPIAVAPDRRRAPGTAPRAGARMTEAVAQTGRAFAGRRARTSAAPGASRRPCRRRDRARVCRPSARVRLAPLQDLAGWLYLALAATGLAFALGLGGDAVALPGRVHGDRRLYCGPAAGARPAPGPSRPRSPGWR